MTPADLLAAALRRSPSTPLLTAYDDSTGERVELSTTTFANWVAKAANLFRDEFDIAPGSRVVVALPPHWQTAAVLLAVWSCGAAVLETAAEADQHLADADLVLAAQDRLEPVEEALGGEGTPLLGLSLDPMGLGMRDYAGQARDFALEVRTAGDVFVPYEHPSPEDPGLVTGGLTLSLGALVETAGELGGRLGLAAGDRVLVDDATAAETGPIAWLLAPLAAQASVVLCRNARSELLPRRAEVERVTATLGTVIEGVRELGRPS